MAILNYTTKIDPHKTVGEIQGILAKHGASNVSVDFDQGLPISVSFLVTLNTQFLQYRLPSNSDGVYKALQRDRDIAPRFKTQEQAKRVAWRITKDWIEAQMAVVEAGLASMPEVFLPYAVADNGRTLFELVEDRGIKALTGARQ